jgi:microcystin-dependent protein
MPSTYSPDLRIELIANGEQSGTWGTTTNSNLGTLIEDAIAGRASVAVTSANQPLTASDGAADQARCAAVDLSIGAWGSPANFAVYVPPVTKLYVVRNTDSTYTATVYCSTVIGNTTAAGTGVAIPPGKSVLLRSDGTNIIEQLNYIAGNFQINGATTFTGASTFGDTVTLDADPTLALQAATKQYVDAAASSSSPSGALIMWPTGTAPSGWLLCNGAAVSRSTYAALFAVIGTTFGAGDTTTTFNLPDYRDRMPIGADTIAASIGATGGSKDAIVVSHTHSVNDSGHSHDLGVTTFNIGSAPGTPLLRPISIGNPPSPTTTSTTGISIASTGSSGTNANMPPYLGINFIIKT